MEPLLNGYPQFVSNQVLTSSQLNDLRNYLDQQNRLTRARLLGTGIVCGLTWSFDTSLSVAAGFGITSAGYLADHPGDTYDLVRPYVDPDHDEDGVPSYGPWRRTGEPVGQIDLLELSGSTDWPEGEAPLDAEPLTAATLTERVVVLYLERSTTELDSCLATDCDNKGHRHELTLRVLLVRRDDLVVGSPDQLQPSRVVDVPRLHTALALSDLAGSVQLQQGYARIITEVVPQLAGALERLFDEHAPLLGGPRWQEIAPTFDAFRSAVLDSDVPAQYRYDGVKDLARAHDEAAAAVCRLVLDCRLTSDHPRHLMLGATERTPGYRHEFLPSALHDVADGDLQRVRALFHRVVAIAAAFWSDPGPAVRLTPSHTEAKPLGTRAVPVYLEPTETIVTHWQPQMDCTVWPPWSYHDLGAESLRTAYNRTSLIRIEGHVGRSCREASTEIRRLREEHHAEFEMLALDLNEHHDEPRDEIEKALTAVAVAQGDLRRALAEIAVSPPIEWKTLAGIERARLRIAKARQGVQDAAEAWADGRCDDESNCDTSAFEATYREARARLTCALADLLDAMSEVPEVDSLLEFVPADPDERAGRLEQRRVEIKRLETMLPGLVDPKTRPEIIERYREAKRHLAMLELGDALVDDASWLQLLVAFDDLRDSIRALLKALPFGLCAFDYPRFAAGFKNVAGALAVIRLAATHLALSDAVSRTTKERVWAADPPEPATGAFDRCSLHTFALLGHSYAQVLTRGRSLAHFAERHPGLEHLAGVEKGGTFVIVCDEEQQVVADFAMAGVATCCCEVDGDELCLPPAAATDVAVADLGHDDEGEGSLATIDVDVLRNDYQPVHQGELRVRIDGDPSDLGGRVEFIEPGTLRYVNPSPVPGTVDHFEYALVGADEDCRAADRGHVFVLLRTTDVTPEPGPEPELGSIGGVVTSREEPLTGIGVSLENGGQRRTTTDDEGAFLFADLAPGEYRLTAHLPWGATRTETVPLAPGESRQVTFAVLAPSEPGSMAVVVQDARTRKRILKATVGITGPSGPRTSKEPTREGVFLFAGLASGTYRAAAEAADFSRAGSDDIVIRPGTQVEVVIPLARPVLDPRRPPFDPGQPPIDRVIEVRDISPAEADALVAEVYGPRAARRTAALEKARSTPGLARSNAFKSAEALVGMSDPGSSVSDAELVDHVEANIGTMASAVTRADPTRVSQYRLILAAAAGAILDRITMNNPQELSGDALRILGTLGTALREARIGLGQGAMRWTTAELKRELGIATGDEIRSLLP